MLHIYPDSLFILTVRDPDEWYTIASAHYRNMVAAMGAMPIRVSRMLTTVFGTNNYKHKTMWIAAYNRHNREVQRVVDKDLLLVLDVDRNQGFYELCRFLAKSIRDPCKALKRNGSSRVIPFPKLEITSLEQITWHWNCPLKYSQLLVSNESRFAYVSKLFNPNLESQRGFLTAFLVSVESLRQSGSVVLCWNS